MYVLDSFNRRNNASIIWSQEASSLLGAACELWLRTGTGAIRNCVADFSRPRCVSFQAAVGILDETKAGFKGLEKYPETTRKTGDGPGHKNEEDQPQEGKARIVGHCCCRLDGWNAIFKGAMDCVLCDLSQTNQ
jgi:hypothetical protein